MKALVMTGKNSLDQALRLEDRGAPVLKEGEVLIRVKAVGLNRADLLQCQGRYPAPAGVPADIPGLEVAGEVISTHARVEKFKVGDRVCALLAGGGFAEEVAVNEKCCLNIPERLSFSEAASLPEALFTVWLNVFKLGALKSGEKLLVHGGSSGIGAHAIVLARALGAQVSVTVGSQRKAKFCQDLGAREAIIYKSSDFEEELKSVGFDVILDMVGGEYLEKNLRLLNFEGRLVYINAMRGRFGKVDILRLMQQRITLTGSTLRARSLEFKGALAREIEEQVWPLYQQGLLKPCIYQEFPFEQVGEALALMHSSEHMGKIVLRLN